MEEKIGHLKNRKWSDFGNNRTITSSSPICKKSANTERDIGIVKSLAALTLGDQAGTEEPRCPIIKQKPMTEGKSSGLSRKRFIKIPSKCMEKFNVEDFSNNNYKAIEAVINDILTTRRNKSAAKRSKAKTDLRPKTLGGLGINSESERLYKEGRIENNIKGKDIKDMKPKSAQPRSYRYYYKEGLSKDKRESNTSLVPKSLSDLTRIYEEATKSRQNRNGTKTAQRRKVANNKVINNFNEIQ